jgi:hypothetical protein
MNNDPEGFSPCALFITGPIINAHRVASLICVQSPLKSRRKFCVIEIKLSHFFVKFQ